MNELRGRWILVTGASSGIGEACARRLTAYGANLVLWARRQDRLADLARELEAAGAGEISAIQVDVRDRDLVIREAARLVGENRVPDVILNNAGPAPDLDPPLVGVIHQEN